MVLGLNDKFLIYPSDNRTEVYLERILNICMSPKKEKGAFHDFNWVETFSSCSVFSISKNLS